MNATELFNTIFNTISVIIAAMVLGAVIAFGLVTGAFKDACERGIEEMKSEWPILLGLTIIAFLPLTVSFICGWL